MLYFFLLLLQKGNVRFGIGCAFKSKSFAPKKEDQIQKVQKKQQKAK